MFPNAFQRPLLGLAIAAALPAVALADDEVVLTPVVVSDRQGQAAPLAPTAGQARAKLARVPGGTNLAEPQQETRLATLRDALDYQPGIIIQDFFGGADQPRLSIRGSGIQSNPVNRGVLLLQDGLPLNEADGSFIIGLLEPRNSAFITARRGANATTPGATTLGGELDFQSMTGADGRGQLRLEGGSFGRQALQAAVGGQGEQLDGRLSVSADNYDGYRYHSGSTRSSVQANTGFRLGDRFENRSYLSWTDLQFDIPTVVPRDRIDSNPRGVMGDGNTAQDKLLNVYNRDPRRAARQLRLANRSQWGDDALWQGFGVYWQNTDDRFNNQTSTTVTGSETVGAQWTLDGKWRQLDYRLALAWSRSDMDRELYATSPKTGQPMQRFGNYALQAENREALAGLGWQFAPDWQLVGEVKWSHVVRDARSRDDGSSLDQSWDYATPKIGLNWTPRPGLRGYANISRSNEAPTYWEIVSGEVSPQNPAGARAELVKLGVQKATTFEIGTEAELLAGRLNGSLTAYYSDVDDELISTTDGYGIRVGTYNYAGGTRHQGIEAGLNGSLPVTASGAIDYRLAWTYSDFRFRGGEFAGNQIAGVPRHLISAELLYRTGDWRFGPNVRWLPQATPTDHANTSSIYQDPYALLGFKVDYRRNKQLSLFLQLDNITDERYASSYAIRNKATAAQPGFLPGNGFSVSAGLGYRF